MSEPMNWTDHVFNARFRMLKYSTTELSLLQKQPLRPVVLEFVHADKRGMVVRSPSASNQDYA